MMGANSVIMPDKVKAVDNTGMLKVRLQHHLGNFRLAVDFQAPLGLTVLFGFSGAGKSVTLRSLAGLIHAERGYVAVGGQVLFDSEAGINLPPQERRIGYVPQQYALFPHLTVAENILFALPRGSHRTRWRKISLPQQVRLKEMLAALELQGLEQRYPASLSGGQQQRVALARALAAEPRLLLLDEPFNALDVAIRERLRDMLKQLQRHFAIPIVLVTHDHAEVQQLADKVVVLQQGHVAQAGCVQEIFLSPATPEVARLVGQDNIFGGYVDTPCRGDPGDRPDAAPTRALRLAWLQSTDSNVQDASSSPVGAGVVGMRGGGACTALGGGPRPTWHDDVPKTLPLKACRPSSCGRANPAWGAGDGEPPGTQTDEPHRCWLPLPLPPDTGKMPPDTSEGYLPPDTLKGCGGPDTRKGCHYISLPAAQTLVTGCIRTDEVLVHRWSSPLLPPVWTERGAVQWIAELAEAQSHGTAIRLLLRPQWANESTDTVPTAHGILKIYVSRRQWREIEVLPGQLLLLEIQPEAIHLFEGARV